MTPTPTATPASIPTLAQADLAAQWIRFPLLLALLIVLAPFAHNFLRERVKTSTDLQPPAYEYRGPAWAFEVGAFLTLWGAVGQLILLGFLVGEFEFDPRVPRGYIGGSVAAVFQAVLWYPGVLLMLYYGGRMAYAVVAERLQPAATGHLIVLLKDRRNGLTPKKSDTAQGPTPLL